MKHLYRVEAPHYVAGFEAVNGKIVKAAPIIHWAYKKSLKEVLNYLKKKNYKYEIIEEIQNV